MTMEDHNAIVAALAQGGTIDITTTGRRSGQARRIEVGFFDFDGHVYISGSPGKRGWLANLVEDPRLTFHLKGKVQADLPATVRIITDEVERRPIIERVCERWGRAGQVEQFVAGSPLIEVTFDDPTLPGGI